MYTAKLWNAVAELERVRAASLDEVRRYIADNWVPYLEPGDRITLHQD